MSSEKGHGNKDHSQNDGLFFLMRLQLSVAAESEGDSEDQELQEGQSG